jgi:hypothetical protein
MAKAKQNPAFSYSGGRTRANTLPSLPHTLKKLRPSPGGAGKGGTGSGGKGSPGR